MSVRIFLHAVRMVFDQLGGAMRVSGVLYLGQIALFAIILLFFPPTVVGGKAVGFPWPVLPLLLISTLLGLWIAVGWHRFVLLDEVPDQPIPTFRSDRILAYFGRALQSGIIIVAVAIVLGLVYGVLVFALQGAPIVAIAGMVALITVALLIFYKLAAILPGAAIGKPVNIGQAWAATSGKTGTLLGLALISVIASVVIDLPIQLLVNLPYATILLLIWTCVTSWIKLMVGVSILTAIYGAFVENRPVP